MYVHSPYAFILSCRGRGFTTGGYPVQGILQSVSKIPSSRLVLNRNRPKDLMQQREEDDEGDIETMHLMTIVLQNDE
jgi:hypothetical protein